MEEIAQGLACALGYCPPPPPPPPNTMLDYALGVSLILALIFFGYVLNLARDRAQAPQGASSLGRKTPVNAASAKMEELKRTFSAEKGTDTPQSSSKVVMSLRERLDAEAARAAREDVVSQHIDPASEEVRDESTKAAQATVWAANRAVDAPPQPVRAASSTESESDHAEAPYPVKQAEEVQSPAPKATKAPSPASTSAPKAAETPSPAPTSTEARQTLDELKRIQNELRGFRPSPKESASPTSPKTPNGGVRRRSGSQRAARAGDPKR